MKQARTQKQFKSQISFGNVRNFRRISLSPKNVASKTVVIVRKRPLVSFFTSLLVLLILIIAGNVLFSQKVSETPKVSAIKSVNVYTIGEVPKVSVSAQIKKEGVVTIMAQSSGVVQNIAVSEGDTVYRGTNLLSLSSNYNGANAAVLQRELAENQNKNVLDTYNTQKDIVQRQRDLAQTNANNSEELRKISESSISDTNSLLSLNQTIVDSLSLSLQNLISSNTNHQNDTLILQTQQQLAGFESAVIQLNSQLKQLNYSINSDNPPGQLTDITHDLAKKQLDIQEKALELAKETSSIQLNLAYISESLMFPGSPYNGIVQKIFVSMGQLVSPGTPLVTIYNPQGNITAVAKVTQNIARSISPVQSSSVWIGKQSLSLVPSFISQQATDGQLYSIIYSIPQEYQNLFTDQQFLTVEIPIGHSDTTSAVPYIPLDAIFQTQDSAFVYVVKNNVAESKTLELGQVLGSDVEITKGLTSRDQIILDRNVIAGDRVEVIY